MGEIRLGEMGLGEMGLGEMGQNRNSIGTELVLVPKTTGTELDMHMYRT